ncbi:MAG: NUMOD4 motif-containing HNH endonuclease [Gammaproteobacteria bacterium]|nr:NUMOD4 motif-containing HNH endonuclease [Gammaproteobacteria bacterium]
MDMANWKDLYDDYEISDVGDIISYRKSRAGILLSPTICKDGYKRVQLITFDGKKAKYVHRLVYENFIGDIEDGLVVDHIDEDKLNNSVFNLQLMSISENVKKSLIANGWEPKKKKPKNPDRNISVVGDKFRVRVMVGGKRVTIGMYSNVSDAREGRDNYLGCI